MKRVLPWAYYAIWFVLLLLPGIRLFADGTQLSAMLAHGYLFWGFFAFLLIAFRYGSKLHEVQTDAQPLLLKVLTGVVLCATVLVCTLPMGLSPRHNGEMVDFHYQYEGLTEAIAGGQLYLKQTPPAELLAMENPYDFEARQQMPELDYEWDTALFDGHYFVYFGVAPVVLVFLPYKLITGRTMLSYHGTQLFTALFIIGLFALFQLIAKRFFPKAPYSVVTALSAAFSVMSVFFATGAPALYCTAITCGICFQVWSLYFHMRAVYVEQSYRAQTVCAVAGSLCGAIVFAARPPVGLMAVLSAVMLWRHIRNTASVKDTSSVSAGGTDTFPSRGRHKTDTASARGRHKTDTASARGRHKTDTASARGRLARQVVLAAVPYVLVALPLMWYNARRFGSPFEFGQAYMLTNGDLTTCRNFAEHFDFHAIMEGIHTLLFRVEGFRGVFPYFQRSGVFANFPVLLFLCVLLLPSVRKQLKERGLLGVAVTIPAVTLVIAAFQTYWVTEIIERYRMDVYFLLGTGCFLTVLALLDTVKHKRMLATVVCMLAVYTVFTSFFLYMIPEDQNTAQMLEAFHYWAGWALSFGKAG